MQYDEQEISFPHDLIESPSKESDMNFFSQAEEEEMRDGLKYERYAKSIHYINKKASELDCISFGIFTLQKKEGAINEGQWDLLVNLQKKWNLLIFIREDIKSNPSEYPLKSSDEDSILAVSMDDTSHMSDSNNFSNKNGVLSLNDSWELDPKNLSAQLNKISDSNLRPSQSSESFSSVTLRSLFEQLNEAIESRGPHILIDAFLEIKMYVCWELSFLSPFQQEYLALEEYFGFSTSRLIFWKDEEEMLQRTLQHQENTLLGSYEPTIFFFASTDPYWASEKSIRDMGNPLVSSTDLEPVVSLLEPVVSLLEPVVASNKEKSLETPPISGKDFLETACAMVLASFRASGPLAHHHILPSFEREDSVHDEASIGQSSSPSAHLDRPSVVFSADRASPTAIAQEAEPLTEGCETENHCFDATTLLKIRLHGSSVLAQHDLKPKSPELSAHTPKGLVHHIYPSKSKASSDPSFLATAPKKAVPDSQGLKGLPVKSSHGSSENLYTLLIGASAGIAGIVHIFYAPYPALIHGMFPLAPIAALVITAAVAVVAFALLLVCHSIYSKIAVRQGGLESSPAYQEIK